MKKSSLSLLIAFLFGLLFSALAIIDHRNGNSGLFDLGIFEHILYCMNEGHGLYSSVLHKNIFGDHVSAILFFLVPLYRLFPRAETLLVIQSVALGIGFWITFLMAKARELSDREGFLWGTLYVLYPSVIYINLWDFHPIIFAIPLLLGALTLEAKQRWKQAALLYLSTFLLREEMGLVVFGVGLVWLFFRRQRLWGTVLAVAGLSFFILCVVWIMPWAGGGALPHVERYEQLGQSLTEIIANITLHPFDSFIESTTNRKILTLLVLFGPMLGLSLLAWRSLFYLFIPLAFHYLSSVPNQFDFRAHYMSIIIPFIIAGALEGRIVLIRILNSGKRFSQGIYFALISIILAFQIIYFCVPPISARSDLSWPIATEPPDSLRRLEGVLPLIGEDTPLTVSNALGAHIGRRRELYLFGAEGNLVKDIKAALLVDLKASDPWPLPLRDDYLRLARKWVRAGNRRIGYFEDGLLLVVPGQPSPGEIEKMVKIIEVMRRQINQPQSK